MYNTYCVGIDRTALLQLPHTPCDDSQRIVKTLILVNILLLQYFRMLLHNYYNL